MKAFAVVCLLSASAVLGHAGHEETDAKLAGAEYAVRHMATEHHIDSFDLESFFQLHDLDSDGEWNREEIEAIYGVHHIYSQRKSKDDIEHQNKADQIVDTILKLMDKDKDGAITPEEFNAVGLKGLPSFENLGAEGHHYDVESEFFLHHEEQFHSTPETQTDESYNHPEDLEHFAQHEAIERKEAEREAKYQGITVEEAIHAHDEPPKKLAQQPAGTHNDQAPLVDHPFAADSAPKPKITRGAPPEKQDPNVKYVNLGHEDSKAEWGTGDGGYKQPKSASDKMRKNLPYKERMQYKFRRNWGDF
ncbi:hypothetical protein BJ138DRAFT_1159227 [Hygrophoropsis aurantiaca]|uniref:Uncharacterized protein n=1 Tax=Hygrophoropsis aurantiaca TaxID=72124 RepID=A0ACB8A4T5_9AGAM|nr:hypothetical protein BJ138DRAFT_1159227 [Hygrophoropsis aurantiaca]